MGGFPPPIVEWVGIQDVETSVQIFIRKHKQILLVKDISSVSNRSIVCSGSNVLGQDQQSYNLRDNQVEGMETTDPNKHSPETEQTQDTRKLILKTNNTLEVSTDASPATQHINTDKQKETPLPAETDFMGRLFNFLSGNKLKLERMEKYSKQNSDQILEAQTVRLDILEGVHNLQKSVETVLEQQDQILHGYNK